MTYDNIVNTAKGLAAMKGLIFTKITGSVGDREMTFETADGVGFMFAHMQDCCETVDINDIVGDINDLVGAPLVIAEQVSGTVPADAEHYESYSYTFYKFATRKGYVDVRWLGESNGYYSESVDLFVEGIASLAEEDEDEYGTTSLGELLKAKLAK